MSVTRKRIWGAACAVALLAPQVWALYSLGSRGYFSGQQRLLEGRGTLASPEVVLADVTSITAPILVFALYRILLGHAPSRVKIEEAAHAGGPPASEAGAGTQAAGAEPEVDHGASFLLGTGSVLLLILSIVVPLAQPQNKTLGFGSGVVLFLLLIGSAPSLLITCANWVIPPRKEFIQMHGLLLGIHFAVVLLWLGVILLF